MYNVKKKQAKSFSLLVPFLFVPLFFVFPFIVDGQTLDSEFQVLRKRILESRDPVEKQKLMEKMREKYGDLPILHNLKNKAALGPKAVNLQNRNVFQIEKAKNAKNKFVNLRKEVQIAKKRAKELKMNLIRVRDLKRRKELIKKIEERTGETVDVQALKKRFYLKTKEKLEQIYARYQYFLQRQERIYLFLKKRVERLKELCAKEEKVDCALVEQMESDLERARTIHRTSQSKMEELKAKFSRILREIENDPANYRQYLRDLPKTFKEVKDGLKREYLIYKELVQKIRNTLTKMKN